MNNNKNASERMTSPLAAERAEPNCQRLSILVRSGIVLVEAVCALPDRSLARGFAHGRPQRRPRNAELHRRIPVSEQRSADDLSPDVASSRSTRLETRRSGIRAAGGSARDLRHRFHALLWCTTRAVSL